MTRPEMTTTTSKMIGWAVECKNVSSQHLLATKGYEKMTSQGPAAYVDRYQRKTTRTPFCWDATIRPTKERAVALLRAARAGKYGTLETGYRLIAVYESTDGEFTYQTK